MEREKVIKGLECCIECGAEVCTGCPYCADLNAGRWHCRDLRKDALALLKAQEAAKAEPKRIELADETKAWLDQMDAVDALGNIADICIDWDGYRTADSLGGLVNEIWAYARYCADKLLKAQEPRLVTAEDFANADEWGYLPVWTEEKNGDLYCECIPSVAVTDDDYASQYRHWTSRPTDEQREATPWE